MGGRVVKGLEKSEVGIFSFHNFTCVVACSFALTQGELRESLISELKSSDQH